MARTGLLLTTGLLVLACGRDRPTDAISSPGPDGTPPARISSLLVESTRHGVVTLKWLAPGDDEMEGQAALYDVRCAADSLTDASWEDATVLPSGSPRRGGLYERLSTLGLGDGVWFFGIKAADEVPNWSALSNVVRATVADDYAPARVKDLRVTGVTATTVDLAWTAPGEDSTYGRAARYELRFLPRSMNASEWEAARIAPGPPAPDSAGTAQVFTVSGLHPDSLYYFAVKTADEIPNWSGISNVVPGMILWRLTTSSEPSFGARLPSWSPDGGRIAFAADWDPQPDQRKTQIYVSPSEGGRGVRYTSFEEQANAVRWSPDGTRLSMIGYRFEPTQTFVELWVMDALPGASHTVIADPGSMRFLNTPPAWSPDGRWIAYTVWFWESHRGEVRIVPSAGGVSRLVAEGLPFNGVDWSRDGTQLVYSAGTGGSLSALWIAPAAGGEPVRLTDGQARDIHPAWSPDGARIAFASNREGGSDIWVVPASGGIPRRVTLDGAEKYGPSWSPDGKLIAFTAADTSGITDVWIASVK